MLTNSELLSFSERSAAPCFSFPPCELHPRCLRPETSHGSFGKVKMCSVSLCACALQRRTSKILCSDARSCFVFPWLLEESELVKEAGGPLGGWGSGEGGCTGMLGLSGSCSNSQDLVFSALPILSSKLKDATWSQLHAPEAGSSGCGGG